METNLLNQYLFAQIVDDQAQEACKRRKRDLLNNNASKEEMDAVRLTTDDIKEGLEHLTWIREEAMKILANSEDLTNWEKII